jgi:hypothetical protein
MKNTHTTLDREPLSSETIRDRQNFNYVLKEHVSTRIPLWKSAWFYGPVGIAMVTMVVSAVRMNPKNDEYDENTTLSTKTLVSEPVQHSKYAVLSSKMSIDKPGEAKKHEKSFVKSTKSANVVNPTSNAIEENTALKPEVFAPEKKIIDPVHVRKETTKAVAVSTMPSIAGVFTGRVSVNEICRSGKIECNNEFEVIAYTIQYDNGVETTIERLEGNTIPSNLCAYLKRFNVGSPVFITNIVAADNQGNVKRLPSMSIEPTF